MANFSTRPVVALGLGATLVIMEISRGHAAFTMSTGRPTTAFEAGRSTPSPASESGQDPAKLSQDRRNELRISHQNAMALYEATSRDAQTFEAALLVPEVRLKLERALHQQLSDGMLRRLAQETRSEALYWYKYMQGLEQSGATSFSYVR